MKNFGKIILEPILLCKLIIDVFFRSGIIDPAKDSYQYNQRSVVLTPIRPKSNCSVSIPNPTKPMKKKRKHEEEKITPASYPDADKINITEDRNQNDVRYSFTRSATIREQQEEMPKNVPSLQETMNHLDEGHSGIISESFNILNIFDESLDHLDLFCRENLTDVDYQNIETDGLLTFTKL